MTEDRATSVVKNLSGSEKYFFGYYETLTGKYAAKWIEDDGVVIGSTFQPVTKREISKEDFDSMSIYELAARQL